MAGLFFLLRGDAMRLTQTYARKKQAGPKGRRQSPTLRITSRLRRRSDAVDPLIAQLQQVLRSERDRLTIVEREANAVSLSGTHVDDDVEAR